MPNVRTHQARSAAGNTDAALQSSAQLHLRFRSEEHTSELQSLMRSPYDVFCLKKKILDARKERYNKKQNIKYRLNNTKYLLQHLRKLYKKPNFQCRRTYT